jgi:hypothetical protein
MTQTRSIKCHSVMKALEGLNSECMIAPMLIFTVCIFIQCNYMYTFFSFVVKVAQVAHYVRRDLQ